jgi:hypothetical protein
MVVLYRLLGHKNTAECWWLASVIPATQEAQIRRITLQNQPGQIVGEILKKKILHKKGLVEWLKV